MLNLVVCVCSSVLLIISGVLFDDIKIDLYDYVIFVGITAGAHRLWSHKGYKATWQLKLILTFFNTIAHQNGNFNLVLLNRCFLRSILHKFVFVIRSILD